MNIQDVAIFKDSQSLLYIYKKTEKLVSAIYLLSNFISDKEPLKWQLRDTGVQLLSDSLSLSVNSGAGLNITVNNFISLTLRFVSFLEVARISALVSEMNYNILKFEFESLIQSVEHAVKHDHPKNLLFPENFFSVTETPAPDTLSKGQTVSDRNASPIDLSVNRSFVKPTHVKPIKNLSDKNSRQHVILSLLKKNPELGIKDFVSAIHDCSEKTIQRELVLLVSKGQIKKAGEKRWSKYSLK